MGDKDDMTDKERRLAQLKEKWCCRCGHLKSLAQCSHEDSANSDSEREEDEHVDDDTNDADSDEDTPALAEGEEAEADQGHHSLEQHRHLTSSSNSSSTGGTQTPVQMVELPTKKDISMMMSLMTKKSK